MCETEKTMTEVAQILPVMSQRGTFKEIEQMTTVIIVTLC